MGLPALQSGGSFCHAMDRSRQKFMSSCWICYEAVLLLWVLGDQYPFFGYRFGFFLRNLCSENGGREILRRFCEINPPENV